MSVATCPNDRPVLGCLPSALSLVYRRRGLARASVVLALTKSLGKAIRLAPRRWFRVRLDEERAMVSTLAYSLLAWETFQTVMLVALLVVVVGYFVWKSKQE